MTKTIASELENNKDNDFLNSLKANEPLKKVLFKAKNVSKTLMSDIVPQMAKAVNSLMIEINSGKKTSLKDWNTIKFLRQHLYNLSSYDRSKDVNSAFEMSITRAIKLAIMMYDNKDEFEVSNDNEVFIMSKVATPMIDVKLKGQKGGSKKQKNTSEELVEVNTGTIDKVYSAKYPTTSRSTQTTFAANTSFVTTFAANTATTRTTTFETAFQTSRASSRNTGTSRTTTRI